eukprot:GHVN01051867.1.p2 GENE.GHVN01051867.1~~GHVN01051867.1.p2  ORF type:complete len:462 (+),score=77.85 GHVN01051867.1:1991-3376(+)
MHRPVCSAIKHEADKFDTTATCDTNAPRTVACEVDVSKYEDLQRLKSMISHPMVAVVVSLLPPACHSIVAQLCIEVNSERKRWSEASVIFVTTSYVDDKMKLLEEDALATNTTLLNECGLDPGLDHMALMEVLDDLRADDRVKKIVGITSLGGGIPAPEVAEDNPFGYKLSWRVKGMLSSAGSDAVFRKDGKLYHITGGSLFDDDSVWKVSIGRGLSMEVIANRDSIKYEPLYKLDTCPKSKDCPLQTMYRGSLRHDGYCSLMNDIQFLGLLSMESIKDLVDDVSDHTPLIDFLSKMVTRAWSMNPSMQRQLVDGVPVGVEQQVREILLARRGGAQEAVVTNTIKGLAFLGFFTSTPVNAQTPLDVLAEMMERSMAYRAGERDMTILHHLVEFISEPREPSVHHNAAQSLKRYQLTSTNIVYGDGFEDWRWIVGKEYNPSSAMSKTVGWTAGVVAHLAAQV